jgi:hypothetical protein
MPATELVVTSSHGKVNEKDLLIPTGAKGSVFPHVQDWVVGKKRAGISVRDITNSVIVKGIQQWVAYEETVGQNTIQTVFEIT